MFFFILLRSITQWNELPKQTGHVRALMLLMYFISFDLIVNDSIIERSPE